MAETATEQAVAVEPRLKTKYHAEIIPELEKEFGFTNIHQVPKITKVVINMGVGEAARDGKLIEAAAHDLALISGQKPVITHARKAIANFKLREGQPIGVHVTLRGTRMWEFLDRLISFALPRIRDFRGLSDRQFDGHGNYTFGLTEQSVFHEIRQDEITRVFGMDITVVTTAADDAQGRLLLRDLGFPFKASSTPKK
ncbi:MAG: 50S ribosomal protein L5 [Microbacteriaceae bacterium]|jgi:large subunit ribosomal protein L5|nr:50S ribosomal protein L5 [Microbacteriaceae bacterium]MCI1206920.1 50S ribosomal protein L5 [Microbacteriaceae bacterium]